MPDIAKKIVEGGMEVLKEVAKVVTPERVIGQLTGKRKDEIGEYLKKLDPNLSKEDMEKLKQDDVMKLEETRRKLRSTTPGHMEPPPRRQEQQRPYEKKLSEEEEKKAMLVRQQQIQQSQTLPVIVNPRQGVPRRRPKSADFEAGKNVKIG